MTVFLWHMTALLRAIGLFAAAGLPLLDEPVAAWWVQRPLWIIVPGVLLMLLTAVFSRFETAGLRRG